MLEEVGPFNLQKIIHDKFLLDKSVATFTQVSYIQQVQKYVVAEALSLLQLHILFVFQLRWLLF